MISVLFIIPFIAVAHKGSAMQIASKEVDTQDLDAPIFEPVEENGDLPKELLDKWPLPVENKNLAADANYQSLANETNQNSPDFALLEDVALDVDNKLLQFSVEPSERTHGLVDVPIEKPHLDDLIASSNIAGDCSALYSRPNLQPDFKHEVFTDESFAALQRSHDEMRYDGMNRIVNGVSAPIGGFPYQVSLWDINTGHICGGSIISTRFILTAAHCTYNYQPAGLVAKVGSNYLNQGGTFYRIDLLFVHEGFTTLRFTNDVSVARVSTSITFTETVRPVNLARTDTTYDGQQLILSGWGKDTYPGTSTNDLRYVALNVFNLDRAREILSQQDPNKGPPMNRGQICTFTRRGQGACEGDSGGPLVDEYGTQVGVVSWGIPCAGGYPDVFARVPAYFPWIYRITG